MNRVAVVLVAVALVAAAEAAILFAIVTHQAGAGDPTGSAFRLLLGWASLPLIACIAAVFALHHFGRTIPVRGLLVALLLGALVAFLGLIQYSHSTPGFLMLALLIQLSLVVISAGRAWRHAI